MIAIPKIEDIANQYITDVELSIGQTIPALAKSFVRVFAYAHAGVVSLLYRVAAWNYKQIFPQTADSEALALIGEQYGLTRNPAVAAILTATATGVNTTVIPAGTLWTANGIVYQQSASVAIATGTATISLNALTAGDNTNQENASLLSLVAPIAGVDQDCTVTATTTYGEDVEDLEVYRARILQRLQQRPQGGAIADYVGWTLQVPGIAKAFAFNSSPGIVVVYPLLATTGTGRIPDSGKLTEVETALNDPYVKPLCATIDAQAMTERTFTVNVTSLQPNTQSQRDAIESAWEAFFYSRYPRQYDDEFQPTDYCSTAALYGEAVAAGASTIEIELTIDGSATPIALHILDSDEIATLGTITWP